MESRVTRLEVAFEYVQRDLGEIKALLVRQFEHFERHLERFETRVDERFAQLEGKYDSLEQRIDHLPTKANLWTMIGTVGGISLAVIGIFVAVLTCLAPLIGRAS